jgi:hypothetical protein
MVSGGAQMMSLALIDDPWGTGGGNYDPGNLAQSSKFPIGWPWEDHLPRPGINLNAGSAKQPSTSAVATVGPDQATPPALASVTAGMDLSWLWYVVLAVIAWKFLPKLLKGSSL